MIIAKLIIVIIIGYLLGSIPFGLLISRLRGKGDIRQHGSGKTGTTNVLRTAGRLAALLVAVADLLKGTLVVILTAIIVGDSYLMIGSLNIAAPALKATAGLSAIIGHIWPVFIGFRGGRGVATFYGGLLAISPLVAFSSGGVLILFAGVTRYASLGSITGALAAIIISIIMVIFGNYPVEYLLYSSIGAIMLIILHRDNISRLIAGTERKIGDKVKKQDDSQAENTR